MVNQKLEIKKENSEITIDADIEEMIEDTERMIKAKRSLSKISTARDRILNSPFSSRSWKNHYSRRLIRRRNEGSYHKNPGIGYKVKEKFKNGMYKLEDIIYGKKREFDKVVDVVNSYHNEVSSLDDQQLREMTDNYRQQLKSGEKSTDDILFEALAVAKETIDRRQGMFNFIDNVSSGKGNYSGLLGETEEKIKEISKGMEEQKGMIITTINENFAGHNLSNEDYIDVLQKGIESGVEIIVGNGISEEQLEVIKGYYVANTLRNTPLQDEKGKVRKITNDLIKLSSGFYGGLRELRDKDGKDKLTKLAYDEQIMGALAQYSNFATETQTGEGKTLITAMLSYVLGLEGSVDVATANNYLAYVGAQTNKDAFGFLGMNFGFNIPKEKINENFAAIDDELFEAYVSDMSESIEGRAEKTVKFLDDISKKIDETNSIDLRGFYGQIWKAYETLNIKSVKSLSDLAKTNGVNEVDVISGKKIYSPSEIPKEIKQLLSILVRNQVKTHKKETYEKCDVVYSTISERVFDDEDDQLVYDPKELRQDERKKKHLIVDEADQVLIDEAKNPIAISRDLEDMNPVEAEYKKTLLIDLNKRLSNDDIKQSYIWDTLVNIGSTKERRLTKEGAKYLSKILDTSGLLKRITSNYSVDLEKGELLDDVIYEAVRQKDKDPIYHIERKFEEEQFKSLVKAGSIKSAKKAIKDIAHYSNVTLNALYGLRKDIDYEIKDKKIVPLNDTTARGQKGHSYQKDLQQTLEIKEGLEVSGFKRSLATTDVESYVKKYDSVKWTSGTLYSIDNLVEEVYGLPVLKIDLHRKKKQIVNKIKKYEYRKDKRVALLEECVETASNGRSVLIRAENNDEAAILSYALQMSNDGFKTSVEDQLDPIIKEAEFLYNESKKSDELLVEQYVQRELAKESNKKSIEQLREEKTIFVAGLIDSQKNNRFTRFYLEANLDSDLKNKKDAHVLYERLIDRCDLSKIDFDKVKLLTSKNDFEEADIYKNAGEEGHITFSTDLSGRGVDIDVSDDVLNKGGMKVVLSSKDKNRRKDKQFMNRTARNGKVGEVSRYYSGEDDINGKLSMFPGLAKKLSGFYSWLRQRKEDMEIQSSLIQTKNMKKEYNDLLGIYYNVRRNILKSESVEDIHSYLRKDNNDILNMINDACPTDTKNKYSKLVPKFHTVDTEDGVKVVIDLSKTKKGLLELLDSALFDLIEKEDELKTNIDDVWHQKKTGVRKLYEQFYDKCWLTIPTLYGGLAYAQTDGDLKQVASSVLSTATWFGIPKLYETAKRWGKAKSMPMGQDQQKRFRNVADYAWDKTKKWFFYGFAASRALAGGGVAYGLGAFMPKKGIDFYDRRKIPSFYWNKLEEGLKDSFNSKINEIY